MYYTTVLPSLPEIAYNFADSIKTAVKATMLGREIHSSLTKGLSIDQVISSYLPAIGKEKAHEAAVELENGVNDFYSTFGDQIGDEWIIQKLNLDLLGLRRDERVKYLKKMIVLLFHDDIEGNIIDNVNNMDSLNTSDEDIDSLIEIVKEGISQRADLLCRTSVRILVDSLNEIDEKTLIEISETSKSYAKSYSIACYILTQCGENPWYVDKNATIENDPYVIANIAASNIESSTLLALYYTNKITVRVLKEKLSSIYRNVITYVSSHTMRITANVLQAAIVFKVARITTRFLLVGLHFGPWLALLGSLVVAMYLNKKLSSTHEIENVLNSCWDAVKSAWNIVRNVFSKLFVSTAAAEEEEALVDQEEELEVENNDEFEDEFDDEFEDE